MKFTYLLILCFYLVNISHVISQTEGEILIRNADSLQSIDSDKSMKIAAKAMRLYGEDEKVCVNAATIIAQIYREKGNFDSSIYYSNLGIEKALEIHDTVNTIFFLINNGSDYYIKAEYSNALSDLKKGIEIYGEFGIERETDKISPLDYARLLNNIATAYIKTGRYDSSLVYFIKSIKIKEKHNAPAKTLIVSKINIGSLYLALRDYSNGEVWIHDALNNAIQENDSGNIATCYANLGILYKKTGDTLKAIENYKNGALINERIGNHRHLSIVLQNIALLLTSQEKYSEAYEYFTKALKNNNKIQANNSRLHLAISRMFVEQQVYDSAISHSQIALKLAKESGNVDVEIENYELLYLAYKGKKSYPKALASFENQITLKDSVSDQENQEYIQKLKEEFETERKENEIEFLKKLNESESVKAQAIQSRQRLIIIITVLTLALLIVISITYYKRKKKEKELHKIEKKLLEVDLQNKEMARKELQLVNNYQTKQLTTHTLNMMQQNQLLNDIAEKLKGISQQIDNKMAVEFNSIIRDIRQSQNTEKNWELFRNYFENVKKDFNKKLKKINPNLGVYDYRLAALTSLNLNIKESAALLNISPNSVKTARYRLRKRLNLDSSQDLYVFLNEL